MKQSGGTHSQRRPRVRAARHLRLPDRPDPRDGGGAGARGRRGRLPRPDGRAARSGPRRTRRAKKGGHVDTAAYRQVADEHRSRRSTSPATARWSARARSAGIVRDGEVVDVRPRGRRGRAGARPHAVLRRGRRPARRPGRDRARATAPGVEVRDVQSPITGLVVHTGEGAQRRGDGRRRRRTREVDVERRKSISRAHTATHMVHKAFREALGETATQAGSENAPGRFRFDFSATGAVPTSVMARRRGAGQRPGARRPRRARGAHDPGGGRAVRRDGAVRREVRRPGARRSRSATGRASCAAARMPSGPASSA